MLSLLGIIVAILILLARHWNRKQRKMALKRSKQMRKGSHSMNIQSHLVEADEEKD